ncbi:MAG: hypothetical protein NTX51_12310, partial [Verrucomicrobia bacterium]|nr:hypothetical protein [Verrucomicrobiota bacterium]
TWKGDGSANAWDINATANWITNWADAAIVYTDPSKVTFDDSGSNSPAISLNATVLPNTVTFSNTAKAYTVSGSGKISGATGLTLKGTNSVTISADNDFTGGTTFTTNGILRLGNGGAAGSVGSGAIALGSASPKVIVNRTTPLTLGTVAGSGGTPQIQQIGSGTTTLGGTAGRHSGAGQDQQQQCSCPRRGYYTEYRWHAAARRLGWRPDLLWCYAHRRGRHV